MNAGHVVITLCAVVVVAVLRAMQPEQTATVTASAYNSTRAQTDDNPNEGAWGDLIRPGMRIEGLPGTWRVLDRTASHHRNRIDISMGEDVEAAIEWGLKKVTIQWSTPTSSVSEHP